MVFDTTFNDNSVISWQSVLLVEETGVQPIAKYWQTLSRNLVVLYTSSRTETKLTISKLAQVVADDHHKLTIHNRKKDLSVFRQFIRALILFQLNRYKDTDPGGWLTISDICYHWTFPVKD